MEISKNKTLKLLGNGLCLGGDFLLEGIGKEFRIINVYGPHTDQNTFWVNLFAKDLLKTELLILGGDLNFSLGEAESWGPTAHPDSQAGFFSHLLASNGLIDVAPLKMLPTWRNMRVGEARVAKRIDRFLISEPVAMLPFQFRQWIGSGGESDHSPVWLELEGTPINRQPLSNSIPLG
jgi:endonuclease/exonuclease/phosphatase family metal-dependent hydrolase